MATERKVVRLSIFWVTEKCDGKLKFTEGELCVEC